MLPGQVSLSQLRDQARELLQAYRAGDTATVAEVTSVEPNADAATFALADAQRVLARTHGFSAWDALARHVEEGNVAAFCAAAATGDVATVRRLVQMQPDLVDAERGNEFGERTALHFAVLNRDSAMTLVLMELGADARRGIWPHREATAAGTIARDRGYTEVVAIIEQVEDQRRRERSAPGALVGVEIDHVLRAIGEGKCAEAIAILERDHSLVGACNSRGVTPLHLAAWTHNPAMVDWLLDHGAAVDPRAPCAVPVPPYQETGGSGRTPLDFAATVAGWTTQGGATVFMENSHLPPEMLYETVRLLRSRGAALTSRAAVAIGDLTSLREMESAGNLANEIHPLRGGLLSIAVRTNRLELLSYLLDLGLDRDERVVGEGGGVLSWGMPLWFASLCGRHEIAECLLVRGADVNAIVHACGDPLSVASDTSMEALLRRHGARLTVEQVLDRPTAQAILEGRLDAGSLNVEEPTLTDLAEQMLWAAGPRDPGIVQLCLPYMVRQPTDPWWNDVLIRARLPESVSLLLEHGVDPDVRAAGGYTALHHLATDHVDPGQRLRLATLLLDAGASLNCRDPLLQSTPLGWACRWGRVDLVEHYLQRGADPLERDAEEWATPLAWALKRGHCKIASLLQTRAAELQGEQSGPGPFG